MLYLHLKIKAELISKKTIIILISLNNQTKTKIYETNN
jgi:hypothetical protein